MNFKLLNHLALFIIFLLFIGCSSQRTPMQIRNVDDAYVKMSHYENDTTAKALILGDYGVSQIRHQNQRGFQNYFTRHLRVKIFDADAFDIADFRILLHRKGSQAERLSSLRGYTYTLENGEITRTRLHRRNQYQEEISDNLRAVNFTMPNIQEGSVFEVEYTIISPFLYTLPTWYFQREHPTVFSQFSIYIPEYFHYKPLVQGFHMLDAHESTTNQVRTNVEWEEISRTGQTIKYSRNLSYAENVTKYRMDSIPGFKTEPYMNSIINYLSKIEHEIVSYIPPYGKARDYSSNWPRLAEQLLESESFGKQIKNPEFLSEEIKNLKSDYTEPKERLVAAFELVQDKMTWNNNNGIYVNQSLESAWEEKKGNVADINLMLTTLLKELDVEAHPVILSTRNHGIINPAQIMLKNFNYVITYAKIDDEVFLIDATKNNNPYHLLPIRCINGQGRLISENHNTWVELENTEDNIINTSSKLIVKPCGSIKANLKRIKENYPKLSKINEIKDFNSEDDYIDSFEAENKGFEVTSFEKKNTENWSEPLINNYELTINELDDTPREMLYINPMIIDRVESNPFRIEERQFPVDFIFPHHKSYSITIEIPEGYAVEELPGNKSFNIGQQEAKYVSSYTENSNNTVDVNIDLKIGKALFLPKEYEVLKEFYSKVVEEQARNIVIKKL